MTIASIPTLTKEDFPIAVISSENIVINPELGYTPNAIDLYLDLMKRCVTNMIYEDDKNLMSKEEGVLDPETGKIYCKIPEEIDLADKIVGGIWPTKAHTMIGIARLESLQACIKSVLQNNIPGDLIETGVWRGGTTIFMRAMLKAYNVTDRKVWVADSFEGLPAPTHPIDVEVGDWSSQGELAISIGKVQDNFRKYRLLDNQVCFLKGWFKDTLPTAPIDKLSILRLDGDLYESTMVGLENLYPKLSTGGFIIIDDYGAFKGCKEAVTDYRNANNIQDEIWIPPGGRGAAIWQKNSL